MAVKQICCCSVIVWCYVLLVWDFVFGFLFAIGRTPLAEPLIDWIGIDREALENATTLVNETDTSYQCQAHGLGTLWVLMELSLCIIVIIAFVGLCTRKSRLLLPYLVFKGLELAIEVYVLVTYIFHIKECKGFVSFQALCLTVSLIAYSIVAGTYKMLKNEYNTVNQNYP